MTILDKIVIKKKEEIKADKLQVSTSELEKYELFDRSCFLLQDFILDKERTGIIAEFKRASPSKGIINNSADVATVTQGYAAAGASALSVLTDESFFGGSKQNLSEARRVNNIPILRKEFILDEYQILEAKALGSDIILLIAAILEPAEIKHFAKLTKSLGMSVILEVHDKEELDRSLCDDLDAVGVNNRNLANFSVSVDRSYELAEHIPAQFLKVSESGISEPKTIMDLKIAGFKGFLIGENFMKEQDPVKAINEFVRHLK